MNQPIERPSGLLTGAASKIRLRIENNNVAIGDLEADLKALVDDNEFLEKMASDYELAASRL